MMLAQLQPGAIFARDYRVVRPLSQGGMGAVYVVEQMTTGNQRALKIMHPQLVTNASLRQRFVQEARIGSLIKSDHFVQVVGAGVDPASEMPWLAMELLEGADLAHVLDERGAVSVDDAREIFRQLCHALGTAHAANIVHRDLKPENVFLAAARRADVRFTVKVLDFGIAKLIADVQTHQTSALGTPLWMAPEQTEAGGNICPATDVWALGLIAFRMLTGKYYWRLANTGASSPVALMREVVYEPLVAASARAAEYRRSLPPGFDDWFARCVVRPVDERFRNASRAGQELDAVLRSHWVNDARPLDGLTTRSTTAAARTLTMTRAAAPVDPHERVRTTTATVAPPNHREPAESEDVTLPTSSKGRVLLVVGALGALLVAAFAAILRSQSRSDGMPTPRSVASSNVIETAAPPEALIPSDTLVASTKGSTSAAGSVASHAPHGDPPVSWTFRVA